MRLLPALALLVLLAACAEEEPDPTPIVRDNTAYPLAQDSMEIEERSDKLLAALPDRLAGLPRTDRDVRVDAALGLALLTAESSYASADTTGPRLTVSIVDLGEAADPSFLGYTWAEEDVDMEAGAMHRRTTEVAGRRALEQYDSYSRTGRLVVLIDDRYVVEVDGEQVESANLLRDAIQDLDLDTLE